MRYLHAEQRWKCLHKQDLCKIRHVFGCSRVSSCIGCSLISQREYSGVTGAMPVVLQMAEDGGVTSCTLGRIASYYYMRHQTMAIFVRHLGPGMDLQVKYEGGDECWEVTGVYGGAVTAAGAVHRQLMLREEGGRDTNGRTNTTPSVVGCNCIQEARSTGSP